MSNFVSCVYWSRFFSFSVCRSALRIVDSVLEASLRCISSRVIQPRIPIKTSSVGWGDQVSSQTEARSIAEASDSSQQSWWSVMLSLFWSLLSDWRIAAPGAALVSAAWGRTFLSTRLWHSGRIPCCLVSSLTSSFSRGCTKWIPIFIHEVHLGNPLTIFFFYLYRVYFIRMLLIKLYF